MVRAAGATLGARGLGVVILVSSGQKVHVSDVEYGDLDCDISI